MPWISKELYNQIPRKVVLSQMSLKKLAKICEEYHILVEPIEDKADIIQSILWTEGELKKLRSEK